MKEVMIIKSKIRRLYDNKIHDHMMGSVDFRIWGNMQRPISDQTLDQVWFQVWEEINEKC